jgi:hypothetical protein
VELGGKSSRRSACREWVDPDAAARRGEHGRIEYKLIRVTERDGIEFEVAGPVRGPRPGGCRHQALVHLHLDGVGYVKSTRKGPPAELSASERASERVRPRR